MIQLDVSIMGQGYRLACREGEEKMLREAVAYLDEKCVPSGTVEKSRAMTGLPSWRHWRSLPNCWRQNRRMVLCPKCRCPKSGRKWRR